jgi:hypothetical protein
LPQKLQRSCSFESVGRATGLSSGARVSQKYALDRRVPA